MRDKDIIFQSTYDNINAFMHGKDKYELVNLYLYIMGTESLDRPPTEMEKEFLAEFCGHDAWAEFIQYRKREQRRKEEGKPPPYFKHIPPFDLQTISGILSFEIMKLMGTESKELISLRKYKARKQEERKKLKEELKIAINDSYEGDIFYKDDGWCNAADVLVKNKLITLSDDD